LDISTDTPSVAAQTQFPAKFASIAIKPDGSEVFRDDDQVWSGDLQHHFGTIPAQGDHVAYAPSTNQVFFH
jgi:hypothetical protein